MEHSRHSRDSKRHLRDPTRPLKESRRRPREARWGKVWYIPAKVPPPKVTAWNGMVSPLLNMTIEGVIWYQGESNQGDPYTVKEGEG